MNKQEAIERLEWNVVRTTDFDRAEDVVVFEKVKSIISQIHEPHKVVVPKFVAEWIEGCKRSGWHLQKALYRLDDDWKVGNWAYDDNDDLIPEKVDMIALAWLFGFEIEQEKLYTVEIPDPNNIGTEVHILMMNGFKQVVIKKELGNDWKKKKGFQLTEEEIKKDFEWAWQFREEVD
ncbi:TPA: DUF1642 domain-containing protein [Streptococcus suis]|uniref:DUF1642 domain-containing protein n=1 Tax=Streptococcus suis TaxID=1307 RepID=UPI001557FC5C|nr:DUF1642 domain-containing protein [Streptococcus suis]NQM23015.1 DUF1642 domain-containing protein [Streptococcus suis]HEM4273499.1 DUF1642 domain-containing protein [Streptococcus suis]HEM5285102.1 DUF1642 domain-containing protein [Streptococcus suis]HEM6215422.1 DUF1642 domain-containing protein [Streptococcus suis]